MILIVSRYLFQWRGSKSDGEHGWIFLWIRHWELACIIFIHSFIPAISIAPLQVLYTAEAFPCIQHGYCIGVSRRSAQATAGKGLVQGPDVAARAGVEPTTLRLKVIVSTKAPRRPTIWPASIPVF